MHLELFCHLPQLSAVVGITVLEHPAAALTDGILCGMSIVQLLVYMGIVGCQHSCQYSLGGTFDVLVYAGLISGYV